jgi:histidinol phosphatase-like enzyme (inositol monophosphatase family)
MQAVHEAAELAGRTAMQHYRTGVAVDIKGDGSPVTVADRSAEQAVRDWIGARFPADGILGEEFGEHTGSSGRRWVLDPIDGTKTFVRGVPLWGSLVAVVEGNTVLAGAACFAAVGETISAARGCGAWNNGTRAAVSTLASIPLATVLITDDRAIPGPLNSQLWNTLADSAGVYRTWGDCFGYLLVATGRAEVMVDARANPWDIACFQPIIEEAGGVLTDLNGVPTAFGGHSIATNAALAAEVRAHLGMGQC